MSDEGIEAFAEKLDMLMSNDDLRSKFGRQAKIDMENYQPQIIWDQWEKIIEKVVKEYSSR